MKICNDDVRSARGRILAAALSAVLVLALGLLSLPESGHADVASGHAVESCCTGATGNVDNDPNGTVDISDLMSLIDFVLLDLTPPTCLAAANISGDPEGTVDISDVVALIDYLFLSTGTPAPCAADSFFMPAEQRMAAVDSVNARFASLDWQDIGAANQSLVTYIQSRPEFEAAGIADSSSNVWARFTDGVMLIIANNLVTSRDTLPDTASAAPPQARPATEPARVRETLTPFKLEPQKGLSANGTGDDLPGSTGIRMLDALGSYYPTVTARLTNWLTSNGYFLSSQNASVEGLRAVGGDGVFYYQGHGAVGMMKDNVPAYGIWTSTKATVANVNTYQSDLLNHRLCIFEAFSDTNLAGQPVAEVHYSITSKFIDYYWHDLAPSSMVLINACGSNGPDAQAFVNSIIGKKASVYFGWTHSVPLDAANLVGKFLIDRLLGANMAAPKENPPQRPFSYLDIYGDLHQRNLLIHPSTDMPAGVTEFKYTVGAGNFGLLAPSIKFLTPMEYNDHSELLLAGTFGADPTPGGNGRVTVDEQELNILAWSPDQILCELPESGPGAYGPVLVEVRADFGGITPLTYRKSNVVNLTEWEGQLHYTHTEAGSLSESITFKVHIRADIHAFRDIPHETPWQTIVLVADRNNDSATAEASGEASGGCPGAPDCSWSVAWSGSVEMGSPHMPSENGLWGYSSSTVDSHAKRLTLHLLGGTDALSSVSTYSFAGSGYTLAGGLSAFVDSCLFDDRNITWSIAIPMDSVFTVKQGERQCASDPFVNPQLTGVANATVRFYWNDISALFPPDPQAGQ